jgi:hypothetical protein
VGGLALGSLTPNPADEADRDELDPEDVLYAAVYPDLDTEGRARTTVLGWYRVQERCGVRPAPEPAVRVASRGPVPREVC